MTNRRSQGVDLKDIFWRALPILGFAAGATVGLLYGKTGLANELLGAVMWAFAVYFVIIPGPFRLPRIAVLVVAIYIGWRIMSDYPVLFGTGL